MLKKLIREKLIPKNIKFSAEELRFIQKQADEFSDKNFSAFVRYAALNYQPKKKELTKN